MEKSLGGGSMYMFGLLGKPGIEYALRKFISEVCV
jgi:hypothetical protein